MFVWTKPWQELWKRKPKGLLYAFSAMLPMAIMLVVWAFMGTFPFGDKSLMAVDFGQQYISFFGLLKNAVLSGDLSSLSYSFTKSLGGDMIGVLGYYLMSPFNIIYILTPLKNFGFAVFLTIWLRYGAIGMAFAFLLIKRYKGLESRKWLVPLFATAYALSGMLVSYQMNVIFYDAMIMLPIVIVYLEELLDGGAPYRYAFALGLTVLLQFYMGYMISIFIALYACYYVSPRLMVEGDWKKKIRNVSLPLLQAVIYSIIGIALASVILLPVFFNLIESKGQVGGGMTFSLAFQINPLDIFAKLVVGGFDNTSGWSAGPNLPNIYIGALGLLGFVSYFLSKKVVRVKKWAAGLVTLVFFISFVNEFVSKIWHMGQNPAGFFFRFSWLFSFFMLILAYQAMKEKMVLSRIANLVIGLVLVVAVVYIYSQNYSFIAKLQPSGVTRYITRFTALHLLALLVVASYGFYSYWDKSKKSQKEKLIRIGWTAGFLVLTLILLKAGYLLSQVGITVLMYLLVLLVLNQKWSRLSVVILSALTFFELGYNAYLSQVTLGYDSVHKFADAAVSVKRVTDKVQADADEKFYRIATDFAYSRTVPSLVSYPGLSTFSSSLERSTMDHFAYMGDLGVNAATEYTNGTPLTDALYGVRYYMHAKEFDPKEMEAHPEKMYFYRFTNRFDMGRYYTETVYEDNRFVVYKNPHSFPLAYGTNSLVKNIQFGANNAFANQNIILNSMEGHQKNTGDYVEYFKPLAFTGIETENLIEEKVNKETGEAIYRRADASKEGIIRYKVIPRSNNTYYFFVPASLIPKQDYSVLVNNKWLPNSKTFTQRQIWQLTDMTENQESVIEFRFRTDTIDMSQAGVYRAELDQIQEVLEKRKQQGLKVTKFSNTHIEGEVTITDDSDVMMTSIPYSAGWQVKVDGQAVTTERAWNSFLSFPITKGKHQVEFVFKTRGSFIGALLSIVAVMSLVIIRKRWKEEHS
ncbi:glycosyltransferase PgfM1 [Streptococcus sp. IMAU11619]|uniref:glycosyltransferase PgfM1 n=3 Tax=unclassified Streptococcus TaxID=2608887 RepID=UPI0039850C4B